MTGGSIDWAVVKRMITSILAMEFKYTWGIKRLNKLDRGWLVNKNKAFLCWNTVHVSEANVSWHSMKVSLSLAVSLSHTHAQTQVDSFISAELWAEIALWPCIVYCCLTDWFLPLVVYFQRHCCKRCLILDYYLSCAAHQSLL